MEWGEYLKSLNELEAYQKKVRKDYVKDREMYTTTGPQKTGGAPFDRDPPKTRAKSAPPGFGGALEEDIEFDPEGFTIHSELEPQIWKDEKLEPEVDERLVEIAEEFLDGLEIPVEIKDIRLTGSLANYNWSKYSDIDLHIVVDFSKFKAPKKIVKQFFDAVRMRWNDVHDIFVKGYEVEIYVEDEGEEHRSTGVYSLLDDEWVTEPPSPEDAKEIDFLTSHKKANDIERQVNLIRGLIADEEYDSALQSIDRIKKKIKKMREAGLASEKQEFSAENIAFKILRRSGILGLINKMKTDAYDRSKSLDEKDET